MVGNREIVVDGLRAAHKALLCAGEECVVRELPYRVHRVVAADVDKDFNVQFVEQRKHLVKDFLVLVDLRKFVAAGAEESRRRALQKLELQLIPDIVREIHILLIQKALNAEAHPVDLLIATFFCCLEDTRKTRIDDSGGTARLPDQHIPFHDISSFFCAEQPNFSALFSITKVLKRIQCEKKSEEPWSFALFSFSSILQTRQARLAADLACRKPRSRSLTGRPMIIARPSLIQSSGTNG